MSKKLKNLITILTSIVVLTSLTACSSNKTITDDFQLWGQPICLNDEEKKVVSNRNLNYYIKHNKMLGINSCKELKL